MLWDPIRALWVKKTPEESVRQKLIEKMVSDLGYPKGLLAVEKDLETGRRFDLLCYAKAKEGLRPLLLVECKADKIDDSAARQAWGYNSLIGAPFLCLVGGREIRTLWLDPKAEGKMASVPFLPPFAELLSKVCF